MRSKLNDQKGPQNYGAVRENPQPTSQFVCSHFFWAFWYTVLDWGSDGFECLDREQKLEAQTNVRAAIQCGDGLEALSSETVAIHYGGEVKTDQEMKEQAEGGLDKLRKKSNNNCSFKAGRVLGTAFGLPLFIVCVALSILSRAVATLDSASENQESIDQLETEFRPC